MSDGAFDDRTESARSLHDDDVFSDRSPRSSTGTLAEEYRPDDEDHHHDESVDAAKRDDDDGDNGHESESSPHAEHAKDSEGIPNTQNPHDYYNTIRANPPTRPFRPSVDVNRALAVQMSSPPPSLFSSPRSATKRMSASGSTPQFSPRGRSTPSRFRAAPPPPRKESPALVLLHVTVLPLRWVWADVLDRAGDDDELSPALRGLREAWRQLQDRVGDNVLERGALLAHPQNDYELLEERLLETLELPLRRRARILECGHYLGPANEPSVFGDGEDDEDHLDGSTDHSFASPTASAVHWCATCRHDIRFDALGPGKVFRVKVYASNGLVRAGAWSACWREMERVDVELEPITEGDVIAELERIAVDLHLDDEHIPERARSRLSRAPTSQSYRHSHSHSHAPKSPSPNVESAPRSQEERRLRDEARMREIYGDSSSSHHPQRPQSGYISPSPPPSLRHRSRERPRNVSFGYDVHGGEEASGPAYGAHDDNGRGEQQYPHPDKAGDGDGRRFNEPPPSKRDIKNASLPKLLLEAARVFANDGKTMAILFLAIVVALLAVKGPPTSFGLGQQAPVIVTHAHVPEPEAADVKRHSPEAKMGAAMPDSEQSEDKYLALYGQSHSVHAEDGLGALPLEVETGLELHSLSQMDDTKDHFSATDEEEPVVEEVLSQTHTLAESKTRTRTRTKVQVEIETQTVTEIAKETVRVVHTVTETEITTQMAVVSVGEEAKGLVRHGVAHEAALVNYGQGEGKDKDEAAHAAPGETSSHGMFGALQRDPCEACLAARFA